MTRTKIIKRTGSTQSSRSNNFYINSEKTSIRTASPINSVYSTKTKFLSPSYKKTIPLPKNIHDYIDDFYEVSKHREDTTYFSPSSSSSSAFKNFKPKFN